MKLILHIGMGKTGSSAIQHALDASGIQLKKQNAQYLGMWFDIIDPKYRHLQDQNLLFDLTVEEMLNAADRLIFALRERAEAYRLETFVFSNEALSGRAYSLSPLILRLQDSGIDVQVIGYARDPSAWLASAYLQWGIRDKTYPGPVQPFAVLARQLVGWYDGLLDWHRLMGEILTVRYYDVATDIVSDFADVAGLVLDIPKARIYERGEDAEIVLRAIFNSMFDERVAPDAFDELVFRDLSSIPKLEDILARSFDYAETGQIIFERAELFNDLSAAFGFDLREAGKNPPTLPDVEFLRRRLLDAIIQISLQQARQISRLEYRLAQLETSSNPTQ